MSIDAGIGFFLITVLSIAFMIVRRKRIAFDIDLERQEESTERHNTQVWNDLTNYSDVRPHNKREEHLPSYFEHTETGTFRALSQTQRVRALNDPNADTAMFRGLSETGKHRALQNR